MNPRATIKPFEDRMLDVLGDPRGQIYREGDVWYYVPSRSQKKPIPLGKTEIEVLREALQMRIELEFDF